jgi:hypothetical protein
VDVCLLRPSLTTLSFCSLRLFPVSKKFLLAFKGKRYVHGIGSDARNALHHLHNGRDVVLVTTCRHGKSWREMKDERCDEDNAEYDRRVPLWRPRGTARGKERCGPGDSAVAGHT